MTTRLDAKQLDAADRLAPFRDRVYRPEPDLLYLDGNSLGMLPNSTRERLAHVTDEQWGNELVRGWSHWVDLPGSVGDQVGALMGAAAQQVVVCDSISVNLFKLACAAMRAQPGRKVLVTDTGNFPTDRHVLAGVAEHFSGELRMVPSDPTYGITSEQLQHSLTDDVALVAVSHVDYRSGAVADIATLTQQAHNSGAYLLVDVAHSVGALPIGLDELNIDFAVGCTYKYLNAGPGAPGFLYVRSDLQGRLANPIQGWWSVKDMFDMEASYQAAAGINRFLTGTPTVLGMVSVGEGAALVAEAGIARLRSKSLKLTDLLIELSDEWLEPLGFTIASPRDHQRRGGHVVLAHDEAHRISQACAAAGVIGDARPPNLFRLAPAPLTTSFLDLWDAMERIAEVVSTTSYLSYPDRRLRVT